MFEVFRNYGMLGALLRKNTDMPTAETALKEKPHEHTQDTIDGGSQRTLLILTIVSFCVHALAWALLLWKIPRTDETIFLHYNIYYGIDLVGTWKDALWLPGTGSVIWIVNILLAYRYFKTDHFIAMLTAVMTVLFETMVLVAIFLIVLLNG